MADIFYYVDPRSVGGDGTTDALTGANAAYSSISQFVAARGGIIPTGDRWILYCSTDNGLSNPDANTVSLGTVFGNNGLFNLQFRTNDTENDRDAETGAVIGGATQQVRHGGIPGTGYRLATGGGVDLWYFGNGSCYMYGLEADQPGRSAISGSYNLNFNRRIVLDSVIIRASPNSPRNAAGFPAQAFLNNCYIRDSYRATRQQEQYGNRGGINNCVIQNCTIGLEAYGVAEHIPPVYSYNTTYINNVTDVNMLSGSADLNEGARNATTKSSPDVASTFDQLSIGADEFVDLPGDNVLLAGKPGSQLVDQGLDRSGWGDELDKDVLGTQRPSGSFWDIGWHELVTVVPDPDPPGGNTDLKFWWKPSDPLSQDNPNQPRTFAVNGTDSELFDFSELANGQYYDSGGLSVTDNPANTPRYTHDPDNANLPVGLLSSEDVATEQFIDYGASQQPPWWNGLEGIWYIDLYFDNDATPVDIDENEYFIYLNTGNQNFFIIWLNDDQFRARFEVGGGSRNLTYVQPVGPSDNPQPVQRFRIAVGFRETPAEMYMYIGQEGVDLGAGVGEAIKSGERLVSIGSSSINPQVMRMWGISSGNRPRRVSTPEVRFYDVFQSEKFLQDLASGRDVETEPPAPANTMGMVV